MVAEKLFGGFFDRLQSGVLPKAGETQSVEKYSYGNNKETIRQEAIRVLKETFNQLEPLGFDANFWNQNNLTVPSGQGFSLSPLMIARANYEVSLKLINMASSVRLKKVSPQAPENSLMIGILSEVELGNVCNLDSIMNIAEAARVNWIVELSNAISDSCDYILKPLEVEGYFEQDIRVEDLGFLVDQIESAEMQKDLVLPNFLNCNFERKTLSHFSEALKLSFLKLYLVNPSIDNKSRAGFIDLRNQVAFLMNRFSLTADQVQIPDDLQKIMGFKSY
jgi:hypothetical protein